MSDGTNNPATSSFSLPAQAGDKQPILHDGTNDPATVPVLVALSKKTGPTSRRRIALLLGVGGFVGLALGILLTITTINVAGTYTSLTPFASTRDSVKVFNELNDMRQEINQINEDKKRKEKEKEDSVQQALNAVSSTVVTPEPEKPSVAPPAMKQDGGADGAAVKKPFRPFAAEFADVDEEIERLEQTQKTLNKILDLFPSKGKERAKDR